MNGIRYASLIVIGFALVRSSSAVDASDGPADQDERIVAEELCLICNGPFDKASRHFGDAYGRGRCGHRFHFVCIDGWISLSRRNSKTTASCPAVPAGHPNHAFMVFYFGGAYAPIGGIRISERQPDEENRRLDSINRGLSSEATKFILPFGNPPFIIIDGNMYDVIKCHDVTIGRGPNWISVHQGTLEVKYYGLLTVSVINGTITREHIIVPAGGKIVWDNYQRRRGEQYAQPGNITVTVREVNEDDNETVVATNGSVENSPPMIPNNFPQPLPDNRRRTPAPGFFPLPTGNGGFAGFNRTIAARPPSTVRSSSGLSNRNTDIRTETGRSSGAERPLELAGQRPLAGPPTVRRPLARNPLPRSDSQTFYGRPPSFFNGLQMNGRQSRIGVRDEPGHGQVDGPLENPARSSSARLTVHLNQHLANLSLDNNEPPRSYAPLGPFNPAVPRTRTASRNRPARDETERRNVGGDSITDANGRPITSPPRPSSILGNGGRRLSTWLASTRSMALDDTGNGSRIPDGPVPERPRIGNGRRSASTVSNPNGRQSNGSTSNARPNPPVLDGRSSLNSTRANGRPASARAPGDGPTASSSSSSQSQ